MNLKKIILSSVKLFIKEKYYEIFKDLILNYTIIKKEKEKNNFTKLFERENFFSVKNKNYWNEFNKIFLIKSTYKSYELSKIEIKYLKNLSILIHEKLKKLSTSDLELNYIIKVYLKLCENQIKFNKILNNLHLKLYTNPTSKSKITNYNKYYDKIKKKLTLKLLDNSDKKEAPSNFYVGSFDLKKFKKKQQIVEINESKNFKTFVFKDKCFTEPNNNYFYSFKNLNEKNNLKFSPKIYDSNNKKNIHHFQSIFCDINNIDINKIKNYTSKKCNEFTPVKNYFKIKHKKAINICLTKTYSKLHSNYHKNNFSFNPKRRKINDSSISKFSMTSASTNFKNINKSKISIKPKKLNNLNNLKRSLENNIKIISYPKIFNYLNKKDLYYS